MNEKQIRLRSREVILVHAPYYIDGERMQEVEIYLNFIGKFEIPQPQLSEEEIKRQKQLKQPV